MKMLKALIALPLMVGLICPIISVYFYDGGHNVIFTPIAFLSAFIGTGIALGFSNYRTSPKNIGNFDDDKIKPDVNQTWMMFFISLILNLLIANLCGF